MLYRAIILATGLLSLTSATITVTVESTVVVCPCTTPGSIFSSTTAIPTTESSSTETSPVSPHTTTPISSAPATCGKLNAICDVTLADASKACCTDLGYYCDNDSGRCTDDDAVEGTPDTPAAPAQSKTTPPSAPSPTTSLTGASPTCGMLGSACDPSEVNQSLLCCTDLGYYCDNDSSKCTDDDEVESEA